MKPIFIHTILLFILTIKCSDIEARDEKTFPNGTLVGKYTYVDAQGNKVHVKYFADGKSYSIDLKGYKMLEDETETIRNTSLNVESDTMVPLKFDFPVIDNIYTIEHLPNVTNNIATDEKKSHPSNANDNQSEDYDIYDSVLKAPKAKTYGKAKKMKYRKVIRRIRQTLDTFMKKQPK